MFSSHFISYLAFLFVFTCQLHFISAQNDFQNYKQVYSNNFVVPTTYIQGALAVRHNGPIRLSSQFSQDIPRYFFRTNLVGKDYKIYVEAQPGKYLLKLGFISTQPACSTDPNSQNIFHVRANGMMLLKSFNPYEATNRSCYQSIIKQFPIEISQQAKYKLIVTRLSAVQGNATVSFLRIYKQNEPSVCDSSIMQEAQQKADHLAHAVPGMYPPITDSLNRGYATVFIDGRGSHTHFSYAKRSGRIVSFEWTDETTGEIISTKSTFSRNFTRGVTRIKLKVIDSACNEDIAYTDITITGKQRPGAYCYFYGPTKKELQPNTLLQWPRPKFSSISFSTSFNLDQSKFEASSKNFITRCIFFVEHLQKPNQREMKLSVDTKGTGSVRLYRDGELMINTNVNESNVVEYISGTTSYEMIYRRTNIGEKPSVSFFVDDDLPKTIIHDQVAVLPIIRSVDPSSASVAGGATVRINGYGLYLPLRVIFNANKERVILFAKKGAQGSSSTQVFVTIPKNIQLQGAAKVVVESVLERRKSESLDFEFTSGQKCDDIQFANARLSTTANKPVPLNQPTSITLGPDNNLYIGTRGDQRLHKLEYDMQTLKLRSRCYSQVFTDARFKKANGEFSSRTILGITFDPREAVVKPYVSVSTLFWGRNKEIDEKNVEKWANGNIERLKPGTNVHDQQQCLVLDKTIVSGLPVADGDHSINEMVFTQNGDLLITVGSFTNLGLPSGTTGGIWETYFSAAVLIAYTSKPTFNGIIKYTTPENSRTARPFPLTYKDVDIYASGLRNLFSMRMTRNGRIYGIDMGPNCKYGNASTSCGLYNEEQVSKTKKTFKVPTNTIISEKDKECQYGPGRPDKLLEIKQGKYYGHPNIQRALLIGDRNQCFWVDPQTDKLGYHNINPPKYYEASLSLVTSAKTGIIEYGSSHFCNRLRGDFLMTNAGNIGPWRVRMDTTSGKLLSKPFQFLNRGGLRVEEDIQGHLLFPKYYGTGMNVGKPKVTKRTGQLKIINALPFRHGSKGGTIISIGGFGFGSEMQSIQVSIGQNTCKITVLSNSIIQCIVPARTTVDVSVDIRVSRGEISDILPKALLYMNI